jgi:hypothetical protein
MLHLKAVVFLRPTRENIEMLVRELMEPKFGEYHLFFSNVLNNDAVNPHRRYFQAKKISNINPESRRCGHWRRQTTLS